jgi:hypothetical protein
MMELSLILLLLISMTANIGLGITCFMLWKALNIKEIVVNGTEIASTFVKSYK